MTESKSQLTASHWGVGVAHVRNGVLERVEGHQDDNDPSLINENIASSLNGDARVLRPSVRRGWLENGPQGNTGKRGQDSFVEVSWDKALDLVAAEIARVRGLHGNGSIFAGSYGWSSAGRLHHAQSQLKRFLNTQGGFVRSEGNYSFNAALGLMPHIVGSFRTHVAQATRWTVIAEHTDLVVMFGGLAVRNTQVSDGGVARHRIRDNLISCAKSGVKFINISPLRSDAMAELDSEWLPPLPGSDTAVMLGLAHTLLSNGLHDVEFLRTYTTGFDKFAAYLTGATDGVVKDAAWAAEISKIPAERIEKLAHQMVSGRTMISLGAGVQRADYGEQPLWMAVTLAAMLGQIGLPGGGYVIGYGVNANIGNIERPFRWGTMSQGTNPIADFIPVAMISDMLLNPNGAYQYQGKTCKFPDARLVWWAGGNPFHHQQDLNKLRAAFQTPETVIVNEINWTATARHADIILPVAAPQEREDFGAGKSDNALIPMPRLVAPRGEARVEFDIYADLAARLGRAKDFTEGFTAAEWLRKIWQQTQDAAEKAEVTLPDWDNFIAGDIVTVPDPHPKQVFLADFRANPKAHPLPTPSGLIELFSDVIADFDLKDCRGHASWFPSHEWKYGTKYPLAMLSGQPKTRLHSQLDNGDYSRSHKVKGREPILINPIDAAERGVKSGDIVELFNDRGRCLAGAQVSDEITQGCVFLWTGAWYDPDLNAPQGRDRHGNPNTLTHDRRTSSLTQSTAAHSTRIELRRFDDDLSPITVHQQPPFSSGAD